MSLTAEQEAIRAGKITASRVAVLMKGDAAGIARLYAEMIGSQAPEDLSRNWAVQRGACTEKLNLDWYERKNNVVLTRRGSVIVPKHTFWAAATLDGWDPNLNCPIECKDVGGREPMEIIIDRYQPQMQWQMLCTDAQQCALSTIIAGAEPVVDYIPRAQEYISVMLERAEHFHMCVSMRIMPVEMLEVQPPAPVPPLDMSSNNMFVSYAGIFLATKQSHGEHNDAKDVLKSLLPEGCPKAWGGGVKVYRDRANRIHIRKDDQ